MEIWLFKEKNPTLERTELEDEGKVAGQPCGGAGRQEGDIMERAISVEGFLLSLSSFCVSDPLLPSHSPPASILRCISFLSSVPSLRRKGKSIRERWRRLCSTSRHKTP